MNEIQKEMTIYKTMSGQRISQQLQEFGNELIPYEIVENSDYPFLTKCFGQDSYTNEIWSTDIETIQRWANDWAGCSVKLVQKND